MLRPYHFLAFFFLLSVDSHAAHLPVCEEDLPIVPAAIRVRHLEAGPWAFEPDQPTAEGWQSAPASKRSSTHLVLKTGFPAEAVLRFYQQMFGVMLRDEPVAPLMRLSFHDRESIYDCFDDQGQRISEGAKVRAAMEKNRKPLKPGKWLKGATFFWFVHEPSGDLSEFTLDIQDNSFACREVGRQPVFSETEIRFSRVTWQVPEAVIPGQEKPLQPPISPMSQ